MIFFLISFQEGTTKLIYAFHPDDPSSENNIPPHDFKSKGARSTYLLNAVDDVPQLPSDTKTFNFTTNKVTLLRLKQTAGFLRQFETKYREYRKSDYECMD